VKTTGTVWCWGNNYSGQLGSSTNSGTSNPNPTALQVGTDSHWVSSDAGGNHSCGVKTDGTAWCWGSNTDGELGSSVNSGTFDPNPTPLQVGTDTDWGSLTAGGAHTCGVRTDTTIWCWGWNLYGQVGSNTNSGTNDPNPIPIQVGTP
jgi:alpha-tubulin suppressor-like RCC1 family protein